MRPLAATSAYNWHSISISPPWGSEPAATAFLTWRLKHAGRARPASLGANVIQKSRAMSSVVSSIQLASSCAAPTRTRVPIAPPDRLVSRPRTIGAVILCDVLSTLAAGAASLLLPASSPQPNLGVTIVEIVGVAGVFFVLLAL